MNTITLFILFTPVLVLILLLLNLLLAVHRPDSEKVTPYECGFSPMYGQTRNPFSIAFYLVGLLFLIFDLEILLVYPYASAMQILGTYGYWILTIFFVVLTIGFVYEFGSGALYFTDKRSIIVDENVSSTNSVKEEGKLFASGLYLLINTYLIINYSNVMSA